MATTQLSRQEEPVGLVLPERQTKDRIASRPQPDVADPGELSAVTRRTATYQPLRSPALAARQRYQPDEEEESLTSPAHRSGRRPASRRSAHNRNVPDPPKEPGEEEDPTPEKEENLEEPLRRQGIQFAGRRRTTTGAFSSNHHLKGKARILWPLLLRIPVLVWCLLTLVLFLGGWFFAAVPLWNAWTGLQDDRSFGQTRTTFLQTVVGHQDSPEKPTQLLAVNRGGTIVILEFPGSRLDKVRTIPGPDLTKWGWKNPSQASVLLSVVPGQTPGANNVLVTIQAGETNMLFQRTQTSSYLLINKDGRFQTETLS